MLPANCASHSRGNRRTFIWKKKNKREKGIVGWIATIWVTYHLENNYKLTIRNEASTEMET